MGPPNPVSLLFQRVAMTVSRTSCLRFHCAPFLLGGLVLALFSGCGDPAPITAEKSKFQVEGNEEEQPAKEADSSKASGKTAAGEFPSVAADAISQKKSPRAKPGPAEEEPGKPAESPEVVEDTNDYGASPQYPLPSGGADRLMSFLQKKLQQKPQGATKNEQQADYVAIQDSSLAAARKLLSIRDIPTETKHQLLQLMMGIHQGFLENKIPGAEERLVAFAKELSDSKDPETAELGRVQAFDIAVNKLAKVDPPPADGKEVVAEIEKFVEGANGSPMAFMASFQKCLELQGADGATPQFQHDMVSELQKIAKRYEESPIEQIAAQAKQILNVAGIFDAEIEIKPLLQATSEGKEGAEEKFLAAIQELLAKEKPSKSLVASILGKANSLEYSFGRLSTVLKLYEMLETSFQGADKGLVEQVSEAAKFARQRIGLVGKPLVIEGVTPDGKPFDFTAYKGKYVLVDFWATWCPPCLEELPNVRANYNAYHAKGFEVIGLSLDNELSQLKEFLTIQGPPWQTVISQELFDKKTVDDGVVANPLAVAIGVKAIPFVVLLDKEGNVDSLHLRGPKLEARLKELMGEPAEKPAAEEGKEKPAEEKPAPAKSEEKPAAEKSEEPKKENESGGCGAVEEEKKEAANEESEVNPYSAKPGLSSDKLVAYIEKMLDKSKSIQARPGFTEAVVEACDRVLAANPAAKETEILTAAEAKFETLHKKACTGDETCDKALVAFTEQMKADTRARIARQVAFFQQERKVLDGVELPAEKIPGLLKELKDYYAAEKLVTKHLRMASSTVALINKLDSGDEREKLFAEFGGLFAKASDKELARYGKKLAQKPEAEESDLVGKELDLAGATAAGKDFKWADYRGKVVLVDFWATWCGPCKKEMPHVKELNEKLAAKGFAVVGVSLDKDQEALAAYLAENQIPWENLAGDETQELAQKYGVRGIPTMMAIGKDGKILGVAHNVASLVPLIEKALAAK